MSLHTWKRRETSAKGTKVPAADPCISKRTQQRLVGRWRWGEKVKKSAQEQLPAILSHHSTRQWRKWTWQSGGWWRVLPGSLHFTGLQENRKRLRQRLVMRNRLLLTSEIKADERENQIQTTKTSLRLNC